MVAVKRRREEISISGKNLDEIQKQLDKLREEQERTQNENLSQSTAEGTGTTNETVTTREIHTVTTDDNSTSIADDNINERQVVEDAVAEAKIDAEFLYPKERLILLENLKTLLNEKKNEVLKRLNDRRVESGWKETNARYRKSYKLLTPDMRQKYLDELFDKESNEDRATANWLARLYSIIRKHQSTIDELKLEIERDARPATKRNISLLRKDEGEGNSSTSSLYRNLTAFDDIEEVTIVSNLTEEEWGIINEDYEKLYQSNPPENPFAPDYRADDFLTEVKIASFQRELKRELKKRFGMDLRQYNILHRNDKDDDETNNARLISSSSPTPKKLTDVKMVTDEKEQPKKRTRIGGY
jgi:hypothetical protein